MSFRKQRSEFTIFIFFSDSDLNKEMKGSFVEAGYESFIFADQDLLLQRIREAAPHVILFSIDALEGSLSDFVSQVVESNGEVQFACVAPVGQSDTLNEYREYNFGALIPSGEHLPIRCLWSVDQICENLYRTYQNEALLGQLEKLQAEAAEVKAKLTTLENRKPLIREALLSEKLSVFQGAQSKEDYLNLFLNRIPCRAIFFKFLPTVNSFVATLSQGIEIEELKGVGSRLTTEESKTLLEDLHEGRVPSSLAELMRDGLQVDRYFSRPVTIYQGLDGLLIFWGDSDFQMAMIENEFLAFHLLYQQAHLIRRFESVDIHDSVTELYNRAHFVKKLDEEIARARRLQKAVSVIRFSIDHLSEVEQSFGRSNRDVILRTIASIIKKTSRVNDLACRTEDNEFSLILPHCARKGAALRAERLRRIIEGHAFAINDLRITISCGVSEYPSLSTSATDLEVSVGKALEFIVSRGGNKVCLFKPTQEFKPDFQVPPM
jgi:diguanylate cyclase (GGDEF)-like protein